MTIGHALLIGVFCGFVLGVALCRWGTTVVSEPKEAEEPRPSRGLVDRYVDAGHELALRTYLGGVRTALGGWPPVTAMKVHFEKGEAVITSAAESIATTAARAYVEGVQELRAALGRRTGIEDAALDEAVASALAEVRS